MEFETRTELAMPGPPLGVDSEQALLEWIETIPRRHGTSTAAQQMDGVFHRVHKEIVIHRPFLNESAEGRAAAVRAATETLAWEIFFEVSKAPGDVMWRIPPEIETRSFYAFVRYGDNGPDRDVAVDRQGWADHRYGLAIGYCRLSVHFNA